ncbi:MAG: AAA family ATPase [Magnetococcales bacterium]|nr:AAA family ATPase [Magnetococcales bacterium]MBF0149997.1 AAA family ATPase [Magnetococcales bacterium]MBF0174248.1 AAA family ATPase [Magnetococcales bacterium]MBF0347776.1 AAA family ATPase [Magnetococcales bacterium]MBF0631275.1 AAA family ATPase [Magnetococcales bacterium]
MRHLSSSVIEAAETIILGKRSQLRLALCCLLARGHLLIEDVPGVGKTLFSQVLARVLGLTFQRIQFTSDLMPADILGFSMPDGSGHGFRFHPGPVFSHVVLADEINRATPKAQSALLEAMEERQVTIEGESRQLPEPFFVIATQNPVTHVGTFSLPESQMDRFMMRIHMGYPDPVAERRLLLGGDRRTLMNSMVCPLEAGSLGAMMAAVDHMHVADPLMDYLQAILAHTRTPNRFVTGLSPRAGLALLAAAKAHAFLEGRRGVTPEDLQAVLIPVTGHRLAFQSDDALDPGRSLLTAVAVP